MKPSQFRKLMISLFRSNQIYDYLVFLVDSLCILVPVWTYILHHEPKGKLVVYIENGEL